MQRDAEIEMAVFFVAAALALLTAGLFGLRTWRQGLYQTLGGLQKSHTAAIPGLHDLAALANTATPDFSDRLTRLDNVLPDDVFQAVRREIAGLVETERSYLPTHKKGGTVAYETLIKNAPSTVALYHSAELRGLISKIVGERLEPTPLHDQSSCSVLFYERPGDHIGWHYDHNFYKGRHITVLIPIINQGRNAGELSAARLEARIGDDIAVLATPPNTLVVFEGQKVLHRVTPIADGERRVILSMTFASNTDAGLLQGILRRIKDVAFFGPRALWT